MTDEESAKEQKKIILEIVAEEYIKIKKQINELEKNLSKMENEYFIPEKATVYLSERGKKLTYIPPTRSTKATVEVTDMTAEDHKKK